jgi:ABC-type iron transport system FetAB ATPase subunit
MRFELVDEIDETRFDGVAVPRLWLTHDERDAIEVARRKAAMVACGVDLHVLSRV